MIQQDTLCNRIPNNMIIRPRYGNHTVCLGWEVGRANYNFPGKKP